MTVEFRLLGDVEACIDGQRLDIGHARQRCVLAVLLVDVNRPVPADQLIDRVWADDPPHRARNALAAYMSRLRQITRRRRRRADRPRARRIHAVGRCAVGRRAPIPRHGSQARATTDPAAAATLFDAALELWRGKPFAALDTPWFNDLRDSLEVERFSVALDRNDAALRAGRHADLLGELTAALQAHPFDERLAGQLMLAQYRSGRQADALDTYRPMRERLVDELGVDPSPGFATCTNRSSTANRRSQLFNPGRRCLSRDPLRDSRDESTSFVGREQDVQRVAAALRRRPAGHAHRGRRSRQDPAGLRGSRTRAGALRRRRIDLRIGADRATARR